MVRQYLHFESLGLLPEYEAVQKIPPEKRTPATRWKFSGDPRFSPNPRFFERADLWISLFGAKFDEEVDFEVHSDVAPQNPRQIGEK